MTSDKNESTEYRKLDESSQVAETLEYRCCWGRLRASVKYPQQRYMITLSSCDVHNMTGSISEIVWCTKMVSVNDIIR